MTGWLEISAKEVQGMQGDGGIPFREFMKQILHAHAYALGIASGDVISDSENMSDGGCDTEVRAAAKIDATGYASTTACWQFKGTDKDSVTDARMRKELAKPYARKLIESGYSYQLAIADDFPAKEVQRREQLLATEIKKINPSAPPPKVLSATMIAKWASLYPALVLAKRGIKGFQTMSSWRESVTKDTKIFVPIARWNEVEKLLRQHLDFSFDPSEPSMRIRGDAGVGKTRCVFETISSIAGAHQLCLYTNDETAVRGLAVDFTNNVEAKAIIVADECLNRTRQYLDEVLGGSKSRIRLVVINNTDEPSRQEGPEPIVEKLSNEMMDKILEENFPATPREVRMAAIDLAEGFVRIAADLCKHGVEKGIQELGSYFDVRVTDESRRRAVEAISLFERVGWKDEVGDQLKILSDLVGVQEQDLREACLAVKDASPGFIVLAGRYFYVTPEAIARVCFPRAWQKWVEPDVQGFHTKLPIELAESFQLRLQKSAGSQIREAFAKTMENAVSKLTPEDLTDKKKAEELIRLVETHPSKFLPRLRQLVESAPEALLSERQPKLGGWGWRRKVVWACEHLAAFPEYFYDVERILLCLAVNETEKDIGNNASSIWQQLFRIHLSGTSLPFSERIVVLRKRISDSNVAVAVLAVRALESVFARHLTRMGGPTVVAGRIPPPDWQPKIGPESRKCHQDSLELLEQALADQREEVSNRAAQLIIENMRFLLSDGGLDVAKRFAAHSNLIRQFRPRILDEISDFMRYDAERCDKAYVARVDEWRRSLTPREDKFESLRSVIGRARRWGEDPNEEQQVDGIIDDLASSLFSDREFFNSSLDWLSSDEANYAFEVGEKLGRRDSTCDLFAAIKAKAHHDSASLLRGYLYGVAVSQHRLPGAVTNWLDALETADPLLLYRIASSIPEQVDGLRRVIRLIKQHRIPPRFLNGIQYRFGRDGLSVSQLVEIFDALESYDGEAKQEALVAAIDIASSQIHGNNAQQIANLFDDRVWPHLKHAVEQATPKATMDVYHWSSLLTVVLNRDPKLVIKKAVWALADGMYVAEQATAVLLKAIPHSSDVVMNELGSMLLDEKNGWRLQMYGFGHVLIRLPVDVVVAWLDQHDVAAARKLASNLPRPFISESGEAVVPEVTERVLEKYGDDEEVIKRFVMRSGVRSYSGDIVGTHLQEAELATRFLNHPIQAVRSWAESERAMALEEADRWRQHIAEEHW